MKTEKRTCTKEKDSKNLSSCMRKKNNDSVVYGGTENNRTFFIKRFNKFKNTTLKFCAIYVIFFS